MAITIGGNTSFSDARRLLRDAVRAGRTGLVAYAQAPVDSMDDDARSSVVYVPGEDDTVFVDVRFRVTRASFSETQVVLRGERVTIVVNNAFRNGMDEVQLTMGRDVEGGTVLTTPEWVVLTAGG